MIPTDYFGNFRSEDALFQVWRNNCLRNGLCCSLQVLLKEFSPCSYLTLLASFVDSYQHTWEITAEEVVNGDVAHWLSIVERDLQYLAGHHQRRFLQLPSSYSIRYSMREAREAWPELPNPNVAEIRSFQISSQHLQTNLAEEKAKALFRKTAGDTAWTLLNNKKPLPITGSLGTAYLLHNRRTYSVSRVKDGAELCAVVRDVPLWDHLLGLKLIIEHNEPSFLKIANVSLGRQINPYNPYYNYNLSQPPLGILNYRITV